MWIFQLNPLEWGRFTLTARQIHYVLSEFLKLKSCLWFLWYYLNVLLFRNVKIMGVRGLELPIMCSADAVRKIFCFESFALSWLSFLMAQGFPSLAINCMQIIFFFFLSACLCMTAWMWVCVCLSEAKPERGCSFKAKLKKKKKMPSGVLLQWNEPRIRICSSAI